MTPSRMAHGQISRLSTPSRSMAASATIAPPRSWGARAEETPGSSDRCVAVIVAILPSSSVSRLRSSSLVAYGPSRLGAAPQTRARERMVLDVPTIRFASGCLMIGRAAAANRKVAT